MLNNSFNPILFLLLANLSFYHTASRSLLLLEHKNSIQFELFRHGLFYSLTYERVIINSPSFKTSAHKQIIKSSKNQAN